MKKTTMQVTVLALALCALLAIPATAYAWGMPSLDTSALQDQINAAAAAAAQLEAAQPPVHQHIVPISKVHIPVEFEISGETTLGEPPVADEDDPVDPGDLTVESDPAEDVTHETTPGITVLVTSTPRPEQPQFVREPDLPFTGGDALPWMVGGALLVLAGAAVVLMTRPKSADR